MTIADVMTAHPTCVDGATTFQELARVFAENDISGVPVVGANGELVGIASKTDLVRRCLEGEPDLPPAYLFELLAEERGEEWESIPEPVVVVEDFMTTDPVTASPSEPVLAVAARMAENRIHRVIVIDHQNRPIGIVTSLDLLHVLASQKNPE